MLSVLARPLPVKVKDKLKFYTKDFLGIFFDRYKYSWGHYALVRSLVCGLKQTTTFFNFNPFRSGQLAETVWVAADVKALEQMIALKKSGQIKKLIAGPIMVISPEEHNRIIASPEIDLYLVNSEWTRRYYLPVRDCLIWPAGVDDSFWAPNKNKTKNRILFYYKNGDKKLYNKCLNFAISKGFIVDEIVYGRYSRRHYKQALNNSKIAVFFSESESQGLALMEAWSMNVPTLVWNRGYAEINGQKIPASAAPFISDVTGRTFLNFEEFVVNFNNDFNYHPRQWIMENMTEKKSVSSLLLKIKMYGINI